MHPSEKTDTATKATASNAPPAILPTGEPARSAPVTSPAKPYTNIQWVSICIAVFSSAFLYGLDTTITSVVQGTLIERFDSVEKLGWLGIGFPLGSVATLATWAKAYGVFDTKWLYIGSLINFAAGSALCGGAPSMNVLIVGRVWAGAGGAGMYLGQLNIFSQNSTIEKRALYISGGAFSWGLGSTLGPIVGAAFADSKATWRWAFFMNHIVYGVLSPIYLFVIRSHLPQPGKSLQLRLKQFDWAGIVLNASMYTSFVISFAIGGIIWPWNDGRTIAVIVVFCIVTLAFALQQSLCILTTPTSRLFPVKFLRSRTFLLLFVSQASIVPALSVPIYYIPLYFQFARGESALQSATRLVPLVIVNIVVVFINGALLPRFKYYVPWYLAGSLFIATGGALLFGTLSLSTSIPSVYGFIVLIAVGTGLAQQNAYSVASAKAPDQVSDAIGFINNAQGGSVVIALTLASLIFQNVGFQHVRDALSGLDFSHDEIKNALSGARSRLFEEGVLGPDVKRSVEVGIVEAIRWSFFPVLLSGAIALVASLFMRWENVYDKAGKNKKTTTTTTATAVDELHEETKV